MDEFCRRSPSQFHGGFAPNAANEWIQSLERIFRAMGCGDVQKVTYASYMMAKEAENWWEMTRRQMEDEGTVVTWDAFKGKFFQKYFPADLRRKKEMEFLRLEKGDMSVGDYAAKFEELARFCPYSALEMDERSKCSKFESGLRRKLKMMFGHQEIVDFPTMVNKCRMYEDDLAADEVVTLRVDPPRNFGPQRNHPQGKGKEKMLGDDRQPYAAPTGYRDRNFQGQDHLPFLLVRFLIQCATNVADSIMGAHARGREIDVSTGHQMLMARLKVNTWCHCFRLGGIHPTRCAMVGIDAGVSVYGCGEGWNPFRSFDMLTIVRVGFNSGNGLAVSKS
ncbi:hypothetical protein Lal_00042235 [Lupinus albus]|nr:hypothetical protein Lal_00042235 [Lupinus albus]